MCIGVPLMPNPEILIVTLCTAWHPSPLLTCFRKSKKQTAQNVIT